MVSFYRNPNNKGAYNLRGSEKPSVLLLAEGAAEAYYLSKWLEKTNRDPDKIAVVCFEGITKLKTAFRSLIEAENFDQVIGIGFFLDAEQKHAESRADSVSHILQDLGLIPTDKKVTIGKLNSIAKYQISLFVSPNNSDHGCIEDIVLEEIRTSKYAQCIVGVHNCVKQINDQPAAVKTLVQAYLGILDPTLCGTGRGFDSGRLDVMHNAYLEVRNTFEALINGV